MARASREPGERDARSMKAEERTGERRGSERERGASLREPSEDEEGVRWGSEPSRGEKLSKEHAFFT